MIVPTVCDTISNKNHTVTRFEGRYLLCVCDADCCEEEED